MTRTRLEDRMLGCIAGAQVGSAFADPVEGWSPGEIDAEYGWLDELVGRHDRGEYYPPGTTEDGIERQKLQVLSIIDNQGPITARDLGKTWLEYVEEESFGKLAGRQDAIHYRLIKAGIPPSDSGYHDAHIGRVGPHRCSHANGLINACHPRLAAKYAMDVARIYQPPKGRGIVTEAIKTEGGLRSNERDLNPTHAIGIDWSGAICAGIAEAMKPSSTLDSVVAEATAYVVPTVAEDILNAVELADDCDSYEQFREEVYGLYSGEAQNITMIKSMANELVPKGFGLFYFFEGDVRATIEGGANFGRDTDCLTAIGAGLAGAYSGSDGIPDEWIETVNDAASDNEYTVTDMTIQQQARGLYEAFETYQAELDAGRAAIEELT